MPALFDTYRFTANDGTADTVVTPLVSGVKKRWERDGENRAYLVKMPTKLLFRGADYTYFRDIYDAGECADISLLIENFCGGTWNEWFSGKVNIQTGNYNASRCEVEFEISPADVNECFRKSLTKKFNWLDFAVNDLVTAKVILGTVETITCNTDINIDTGPEPPTPAPYTIRFAKNCWGTGVTTSDAPDPATAWRPIQSTQYAFYLDGPEIWKLSITTTWARERITSATTPAGEGWISLGSNIWVRPVAVGVPVRGSTNLLYGRFYENNVVNTNPVSNGRLLGDVLGELVASLDCGIDEVVSNFFNINPDGSAPANDVYDYAADNFAAVLIYQKSDIVRATASNDATILEMTLADFFENLKVLNLLWSVEDDAGTVKLRIEHYTYYQFANGLDLTTGTAKYIQGLDSFKADIEIPAFEALAYQESFRPKFLTQRIDYPAACATTSGNEIKANLLCCDFGGLVENPDAGLEGFFLMAVVSDGGAGYLINSLGGEPNGAFSWENVIPALWADGRYHADATATVAGYTVNSIRKFRAQSPIVIRFCCDDDFNPSELVQTQLGWGEVADAELDTQTATLTLNLRQ